jgi:hypothetical protein
MRTPFARLALILGSAAMCTVACSGHSPATSTSQGPSASHGTSASQGPGTSPGTGTLHGQLLGVGGLVPGNGRPWAGTVTVTGQGLHHQITVGTSGAFSVPLPAGRYQVAGHSPRYEDGTGRCRAAGLVTVRAGQRVTANVLCDMR